MGVGKVGRVGLVGMFMRWATRLRFPYLFALTAVVFVFNRSGFAQCSKNCD